MQPRLASLDAGKRSTLACELSQAESTILHLMGLAEKAVRDTKQGRFCISGAMQVRGTHPNTPLCTATLKHYHELASSRKVQQTTVIMSSRQDQREARAEADARCAADEIARARDERVMQAEVDARHAADEIARARAGREHGALGGGAYAEHPRGGGILESVQEGAKSLAGAVGRTFGGAKDTAADKTYQAADATGNKLGEYKDYTAEKAKETNDSVAQKTSETAEATRNKLGQAKDYTVEKATEAKDTVAHKTSETAEATKNKLGEYKDALAGKTQEAKDTTMQKAQQTKDAAAEKARQAKDVTQQKAGEYADATKGTAQEARDRTMATSQTAADKARETAGTHDADRGQQGTGLFGALGNMTGAIKEKLTVGSGAQHHDTAGLGVRLGGEDERAVKERAAEKAASVYFEEKDRLAKERAAERVDQCVQKCVEGCAGSSCAHRKGKM